MLRTGVYIIQPFAVLIFSCGLFLRRCKCLRFPCINFDSVDNAIGSNFNERVESTEKEPILNVRTHCYIILVAVDAMRYES